MLQKTGQYYETSDGNVHETYGLPVLPQGLRSGQDYLDGTSRAHDYTNRYLDIYKQALMYKACQERRVAKTKIAKTIDEMVALMNEEQCFLKTMWCEDVECENKVKEELNIKD